MDHVLRILTWPDYISPHTISQFEQEHRSHIELQVVPSAVELLEVMHGNVSMPDILIPPDYAVRELGGEGRLQVLDHERLPNLKFITPRFLSGRAHDPETRISVIKDWGTTGYLYRCDIVKELPTSWADFWRLAERFSGKVTVLNSPGEVIGAALKMRGNSYNETGLAELGQARTDLLALRKHLKAFETNYRPLMISGEAVLALGWSGDAVALRSQGIPIGYVIPSEGSQIWEDDWAIADGAANLNLAYEFLNFVLRPEIALQEARYTGYATGNQSAYEMLDTDAKADPFAYPNDATLQLMESGLPLPDEATYIRSTIWEQIAGSITP